MEVPVDESRAQAASASLRGQGQLSQLWPAAEVLSLIWPFSVTAMNEACTSALGIKTGFPDLSFFFAALGIKNGFPDLSNCLFAICWVSGLVHEAGSRRWLVGELRGSGSRSRRQRRASCPKSDEEPPRWLGPLQPFHHGTAPHFLVQPALQCHPRCWFGCGGGHTFLLVCMVVCLLRWLACLLVTPAQLPDITANLPCVSVLRCPVRWAPCLIQH